MLAEVFARLDGLFGSWRGGAFQRSAIRPSARRANCGQQVTEGIVDCFTPSHFRPSREIASHRKPDSVRMLLEAGATTEGVAYPSGYDAVDELLKAAR